MKKITAILLMYNAEKTAAAIIESLSQQVNPDFSDQSDWLDVLILDDLSRDQTRKVVRDFLYEKKLSHYQFIENSANLGLSGTLNKAVGLVKTPYYLTCHCDVTFGRPDYISKMLEIFEKTPDAGAITGQPETSTQIENLPFEEKLNMTANLMDLSFPESSSSEVVPVGFAEGRCDGFRTEAVRSVGGYDERLRVSGEDQILAAAMRRKGYQVYQVRSLNYKLSVSTEQDTFFRQLRHQMLFARTSPFILLKNRGTVEGLAGKTAGSNRRKRLLMRGMQVLSAPAYLLAVALGMLGTPPSVFLAPLLGVLLIKVPIFFKHFVALKFRPLELVRFFLFQPLFDFSYFLGVIHGFWILFTLRPERESIS